MENKIIRKTEEIAKSICNQFNKKGGADIRLINVTEVSSVTDYLVIVTGTSDAHISAMVKTVEDVAESEKIQHKQEGFNGWILLDCGDIVIHIFDEKNRVFYMLEKLWADGKEISWH